jgi:hypothetical protein
MNSARNANKNKKYKFLQEIVNISGAGAENFVDGLHKGAL